MGDDGVGAVGGGMREACTTAGEVARADLGHRQVVGALKVAHGGRGEQVNDDAVPESVKSGAAAAISDSIRIPTQLSLAPGRGPALIEHHAHG
ncbi:hypothetical protein, partial [Burkholderia cenocepacia]|uniref:hypothetical protein n=1 Tax=Burkholderia cenocepacia TaxID=95486 RepID=UPI00406CC441